MKSSLKTFLLVLFASLATASFLLSCASDDGPTEPVPTPMMQASGTVGAAGGILTSDDGNLSLTIPAGALAADTEITVTEVAPDEAPSVFDGLVAERAFTLEPRGLEFAEDVEFSVTLPLEPPSGKAAAVSSPVIQIEARFLTVAGIDPELPNFLITSLEVDDARVFRGNVRVLSELIVAATGTSALWIRSQASVDDPVVLNHSFESIVTLTVSSLLVMDTGPRLFYSANSFTFELENGDTMTPDSETTEPDDSFLSTYLLETTPNTAGVENLGFAIWALVTPEREVFEALDLADDYPLPDIEIKYEIPSFPVQVDEEDPGTGSPDEGVYEVALSLSEGMTVFRGFSDRDLEETVAVSHGDGDWDLEETVAVSHGDGLTFLDLNGDPALQVANDSFEVSGGALYGSVVMKYGFKSAKATGYRILLIGPDGGSSSGWVPENNDFGMQQLFAFGQNLTDAQPYDNDPGSTGYCYVNNTLDTVQLVEYNSDTGFFQHAGAAGSFPDATGNAVSAFVREGSSLLAVTDGTPGRLYLQELSSLWDAATYIDDLGDSPRRIRSVGDVAVVSNFASGTLSIVSWSQADEVTISETITVGDGPIGIDVMELPGGNIAIASTGFNDDTYWVTVVTSTGTLVSNTEYSLPAGITGAGHAVWLHDQNDRILISGNTTGNLAVVASGL